MPQPKALFDFGAADAVVLHHDRHAALLTGQAHIDLSRMSVPDGVGHTLLHNPVDSILLILRKTHIRRLYIQPNGRMRSLLHLAAQLVQRFRQAEPLKRIRAQRTHRAAHLVHARASGFRNEFHLLARHFG